MKVSQVHDDPTLEGILEAFSSRSQVKGTDPNGVTSSVNPRTTRGGVGGMLDRMGSQFNAGRRAGYRNVKDVDKVEKHDKKDLKKVIKAWNQSNQLPIRIKSSEDLAQVFRGVARPGLSFPVEVNGRPTNVPATMQGLLQVYDHAGPEAATQFLNQVAKQFYQGQQSFDVRTNRLNKRGRQQAAMNKVAPTYNRLNQALTRGGPSAYPQQGQPQQGQQPAQPAPAQAAQPQPAQPAQPQNRPGVQYMDANGQPIQSGDTLVYTQDGQNYNLKVVGTNPQGVTLQGPSGQQKLYSQAVIQKAKLAKAGGQPQQAQPQDQGQQGQPPDQGQPATGGGLAAQRNQRMRNRARTRQADDEANPKVVQLAQTVNQAVGANIKPEELAQFLQGQQVSPEVDHAMADALLTVVMMPDNDAKRKRIMSALRAATRGGNDQAANEAVEFVIARSKMLVENRRNAWSRQTS